jgi:deoxyribodipyrimidine photolyase-related protein
MGMIYRQLDKLKDRQQIITHAQQLLSRIDEL